MNATISSRLFVAVCCLSKLKLKTFYKFFFLQSLSKNADSQVLLLENKQP